MFNNDITKCVPKECIRKDYCYRNTAPSDTLQSYSNFEPVCYRTGTFEFYMEDESKKEKAE